MRDEPELELGLAVSVTGPPSGQIRARLREIDGERLVLAAGDGGSLPRLDPEMVLILQVSLPSGQWWGESRLLGERFADEHQWVVARPARWQRGQRRYFRLPITLPFLWSRIGRAGAWESAVTRDLSAGGLSFVASVEQDIKLGERVAIRLALGDEVLELQGEVVRLSAEGTAETGAGERLIVGIRFVEVSPRTEERLVRYIFQVETARRRLSRAADGFGGMGHGSARPAR
ncbi:MAG: PilZ domain-containing protein [Limnochordales bacterium]|nr:PilZ domain-containing protein [Limnochordales bacterium]